MQTTDDTTFPLRKRAALLSLWVGGGMLVLKVSAFVITGSAAVLSDALESVVHVVATAFALYSVIESARPPDRSHPYGHGKIEFFSAGFEGALIFLAGIAILIEAGWSILAGRKPEQVEWGTLLTLVAAATNLALGWYLIRIGKRTGSLTLVADGHHVLTDSYTSFGVVAGLALVWLTRWSLFDPLIAIAVALNILWTGGRLLRESFGGLMNAANTATLTRILKVLNEWRKAGWIDVHHLRSWRSGERHQIDFHLTIPRYWDIEQAHIEQDLLEEVILAEVGTPGEVIVHFDPCIPECCFFCRVSGCPVRSEGLKIEHRWSLETATGDPTHQELQR